MRNTTINNLLFVYVLVIFIGCIGRENSSVTREELLQYISDEDNGLIKTTETSDCNITCQLFPCELMASQNLPCEDYVYFKLFFSPVNQSNSCGNTPHEFLLIENQRDTVRLFDYVTEKLAETDRLQVLVVFPKSDTFGRYDVELVISRGEYVETDHFYFSGKDLKKVPKPNL